GFGPHTVADKDGKAIVRERLALITAEALADPPLSVQPMVPPRQRPKGVLPAPASALPTPGLPSRSLPQGVHVDGTPADLPPLPGEDMAPKSPGDSADPRPSPQKKGSQPGAGPAAKPAAPEDSKAAKAAFTFPKGLFQQPGLPQVGLPSLQFMMPLK